MPDVVIPVLDEAAALPWVLSRMPAGFAAIVVDNGSTDGSAAVAAAHGARVVAEPRRGFGAACFAGLAAGDGRARAAGGLADRRGAGGLPESHGTLEGDRDGRRLRPHRARHGGGARVRPVLAVIAKAPVPGRVKTRLCPPFTPAEAAA